MKLILTEAALDDLRSIRAYTLETWGGEMETGQSAWPGQTWKPMATK